MRFSPPAFANSLSLEFEWQQVSSSLQDSSQYWGRSKRFSSLDSHDSSHYFHVIQSLYQSSGYCIKSTNYYWYNRNFHVPQFFNYLARSRYLSLFALSFNLTLWSAGTANSTILQVVSFCWLLYSASSLMFVGYDINYFVSQNPEEIACLIL